MGRLENFIPQLKKNNLQVNKSLNIMDFGNGLDPVPLEDEIVPFVKKINGSLSLKEIFLYLNEKNHKFNIEKCLQMLNHLADNGQLANAEDYLKVADGKGSEKKNRPNPKKLTASYFSKEILISLLQKTTLFMQCDRETAEVILSQATLLEVDENTKLIKEGTKSSKFFVLLAGEAGVYRKGDCLANLGSLSIFGESAAILEKERNADVMATEKSWVLEIDASKIVDTKSPESFDSFQGLKSRLILNQTLAANPLFRGLPTDVLQFFISKCRIEKYGREQTVIEQDAMSGDFYFILSGSVAVIKDGMPVTSLTEGNYFGEVAALFRKPRTASIICETACTFLTMSQQSLFEVMVSNFRLAIDIEKTAIKRLHSKSNVLQLFEEDFAEDEETKEITRELSNSGLTIDDEFLESTQSNLELEVVDFSHFVEDEDEEAS